eukprot:m.117697 g.117697  ORF g.117697 m.117697 type:complete len:1067 (+) comp12878_c0_seq3:129-3329(+)
MSGRYRPSSTTTNRSSASLKPKLVHTNASIATHQRKHNHMISSSSSSSKSKSASTSSSNNIIISRRLSSPSTSSSRSSFSSNQQSLTTREAMARTAYYNSPFSQPVASLSSTSQNASTKRNHRRGANVQTHPSQSKETETVTPKNRNDFNKIQGHSSERLLTGSTMPNWHETHSRTERMDGKESTEHGGRTSLRSANGRKKSGSNSSNRKSDEGENGGFDGFRKSKRICDEKGESSGEEESGSHPHLGYVHTMGRPIVVKLNGRKRPVLRFHPVKELKVLKVVDMEVMGCMLAFKMVKANPLVIRAMLTQHGFVEVGAASDDFNILWTSGHMKPGILKFLTEHQKVNHFPKSYELTRKDRLHVNVQRMQQTKGHRHFQFFPATYLLPAEYDEFYAHWAKYRDPWIVKPSAGSQGRGIYLVSHPSEVPKRETLVLSQYINNPLLIEGFKFDLRIYVAVTSYDPLRIYMYEDGLGRFATKRYDTSAASLKNLFMHLTNYSVNKTSTNYVACDEEDVEDYGNKWSLSALMRYLAEADIDTVTLFARIEEVIIKTIIAGELPITAAVQSYVPHANNCFELYGFDILIDSDLKPWLIEVNLSPSLSCGAPVDMKIKTHLVADFFNLGIIAMMDPPAFREQQRRKKMGLKVKRGSKNTFSGAIPIIDLDWPNLRQYSSEHKSIIRRTLEESEACKSGGFCRIFPSEGSWTYYGFLLEDKRNRNSMLHNFLYPSSDKSRVSRDKRGPRQKVPVPPITNELRQRCRRYHRMMTNRNRIPADPFSDEGDEDEVDGENEEDEYGQSHRKVAYSSTGEGKHHEVLPPFFSKKEEKTHKEVSESNGSERLHQQSRRSAYGTKTSSSSNAPMFSLRDGTIQSIKHKDQPIGVVHTASATLNSRAESCGKKVLMDSVKLPPVQEPVLQYTQPLTPIQARRVFAAYLKRMRDRMARESKIRLYSSSESRDRSDQVAIVLAFMHRASRNMTMASFRLSTPPTHLPVHERQRLLASQLGDFVEEYETETRYQYPSTSRQETRGLSNKDFELFLQLAREEEFEHLLTKYSSTSSGNTNLFLGKH